MAHKLDPFAERAVVRFQDERLGCACLQNALDTLKRSYARCPHRDNSRFESLADAIRPASTLCELLFDFAELLGQHVRAR